MNELIQTGYPFRFFNEEALSEEWILNEMAEGYIAISELYYDDFAVINSGLIASKGIDLFKMGIFGRICTLEEDYVTFGFEREDNDVIRQIYAESGCDLEATLAVWEENEFNQMGFLGFSMEREQGEKFREDISLALKMNHIFFIEGNIDYYSLHWFAKHTSEKNMTEIVAPFSNEGIEKVFRNIPIARVW